MTRLALAALVAGALAVILGLAAGAADARGSAGWAGSGPLLDGTGAAIPQTDATLDGHLARPPGCSAGVAGPSCRPLAAPASPADDLPAALAALGHREAPEDDLAAALEALGSAPDSPAAGRAAAEARAILAGDPLPGRPYSGIPLLNWNVPAKVKRVPAGGDVTVTLVRTPQHTLSDTWLLDFEDPAQPYTITYRVSELGGTLGGELRPTPLLADAGVPLGGLHAAVVSLAPPPLDTGTTVANRFTATRGLPSAGGREATRLAVQEVTVRMPPPGVTEAVVEPGGGPGRPAPVTLAPATPERRAAAAAALGFSSPHPTPAERDRAIARLAPGAPERLLWDDLAALPPGDDPAFLDAARSLGAQDGPLVDAMRTRTTLPAGVTADPDADLTVVLQNGESFVSRTRVREAPGQPLRVQVVNRDGFERRVELLALHGRERVLGAVDWGTFDWTRFPAVSLAAHRPPMICDPPCSQLLSVDVPADTFALWVGDPAGGDQAAAVVDVETGPRLESVRLGALDGAAPAHAAFAPDGDLWVALGGTDEIVRMAPGAQLADSQASTYRLPGGAHEPTSPTPPLGPVDVAPDERGIVWVTLSAGNAIARIDPALAVDGTERGIRIYPLPACGDGGCAKPFAPAPGELPTREPLQMDVTRDAGGNALVWFTEAAANRIGLLRVAPDGRELGQTQFSCGCTVPLGLALDAGGDVWFTEGVDNRIGRLTPDVTDPTAAGAATLRHYRIPSAVPLLDPELSPVEVLTSNPHSVTVDRRGLVWFTESATGKLGRLDPAQAVPGTSNGIDEITLPPTAFGAGAVPADLAVDRAGTVYWADEYGDAVGAVDTVGPPQDWRARPPWRVTARRSLTDSPLLDDGGDVYVVESGANLLTRITAVGAGQPLPSSAPRVEVDLDADTVAVSGLRDAGAADLAVERDGQVTTSVTGMALTGGRVTVAGAAWPGSGDAVRPGDLLRITPHGRFPHAPIRARVAALDATRTGAGIEGRALYDGRPAPGDVEVPGAPGIRAPVDVATGGYAMPADALAGAAPRSVAIEVARPGALVRTTAPVRAGGQPSAPGSPPGSDPSPAPGSPLGSDPTPRGSDLTPTTSAAGRPGRSRARRADHSCPSRLWLTGSAGHPNPWLLGRSTTGVRRCLGAPSSRTSRAGGEEMRFAGGLELTFRAGRVHALAVTGRPWTSARGGLRVGATVAAIRRALPRARPGGRAWRAALPLPGGGAAEVRVELDRRRARVVRIVVRVATVPARPRATARGRPGR